jgi:tetratricopeptide (TPR) repeat protein
LSDAFVDRWGSPVFATNRDSVALLERAVEDLVALSGEPVALADAAAADPDLVLARVLQAYLALYSTAESGFEIAGNLVVGLDAWDLGAGERELLHVLAAQSWASGEWERAVNFLGRALLHDPRDLLALKVAQDLYFFLGDKQGLRGVVERVLRAWPQDRAGWGYVQGMYAFGLEENGLYVEAEDRARAALGDNARDVWAVHALAHVFEMEGAQHDGIEFLAGTVENWGGSYFAVHNWWHRALYHLELGALDDVLALYDGTIRQTRSNEWLDIVDAASLLWRLHLFGVDVEGRANDLADDVLPLLGRPVYVFNDWHVVMVAGLAGRREECERVILVNRFEASGTNRRAIDGAGLGLLEGFHAFAQGDPAGALRRLHDSRPEAYMVGGSHAQRDIVDLTLLAAAARSGNGSLCETLLSERLARKPSAKAAAEELVRVNSR